MADEDDIILTLMLDEIEEEEKILLLQQRGVKRNAVHPIFRSRTEEGFFNILINKHLLQDEKKFREFFRLNIAQFNYILDIIKEDIKKDSSNKHPHPITPEEKLALTLRFLATGESYRSLAFSFRISHSYTGRIVQTTLSVLRKKLMPILLPPMTQKNLKQKAEEFEQKWNFPNCSGAIDGKHVRIICPMSSGSLYFNYKNFFSIVLLAVVDANCKFIFIDVGSYGKEGDSAIFEKSNIGKYFKSGNMFPPSCRLPNSNIEVPYVIVGDEAFPLQTHMMKPFSRPAASSNKEKAIFNYRLSRARRVSENAFGLLSQVFRIFYRPISLKPEITDDLIIVACCLHNFLKDAYLEAENKPYYEFDSTELPPSENFTPLARTGGFANIEGFSVRDLFMEYFNGDVGSVTWQNQHISKTT